MVEEDFRLSFRVVEAEQVKKADEEDIVLVILLGAVVVEQEIPAVFVENQVGELLYLFLILSAEECSCSVRELERAQQSLHY